MARKTPAAREGKGRAFAHRPRRLAQLTFGVIPTFRLPASACALAARPPLGRRPTTAVAPHCRPLLSVAGRAAPAIPAMAAVMLLLCLLLSGCTSLAPPYTAPALPVPARYPDTFLPQDALGPAADWRDYFIEPGLQKLISQALGNSRDLRAAVLRVQEAGAIYGIARADRLPSVVVQAGADRSRVPADLNVTGLPVVAGQYQVGLGLASWELDFWGRVRSLQDAALEAYLGTVEARRAATLSLVAQVASGYLVLQEFDARIALASRTLNSRQESLRIFSRRVAVGSTSRLDLTQVQTLAIQAQTLSAQLELGRAEQVAALTLLIGDVPDLPLPPRSEALAAPPALRAGLPSELLAQRPDIAGAEHRLKAANADIGAARAAFFPRVALTGSLGTASAALDGLFDSGSRAWTFSPSITLPLFNGGRLRNNLTLSEVRRDLALAAYEKTVQSAFRDVSNALSAQRWLSVQASNADRAQTTQTERARLSKLRYDNGAASFLEVLDAERDLLAAQQQLVQARRSVQSNRVDLYVALGGGALGGARGDARIAADPTPVSSPFAPSP